MDQLQIKRLTTQLRQIVGTNVISTMAYNAIDASRIRESVLTVAKDAEREEPKVSQLLIRAKDHLFFSNQIGQAMLNPYALGEVIFGLDYLASKQDEYSSMPEPHYDMWSYVHPLIIKSSKKLYDDGHFADAAEDAFIEINDRAKRLFAILRPGEAVPDGESAMTTVFSAKTPLLSFVTKARYQGRISRRCICKCCPEQYPLLGIPKHILMKKRCLQMKHIVDW